MRGHCVQVRPKMEKRIPNDADDAGSIISHQHHWGSVSPFPCFWAARVTWARPDGVQEGTTEASMSLSEFYDGFAGFSMKYYTERLIRGVMGSRVYDGSVRVFCVWVFRSSLHASFMRITRLFCGLFSWLYTGFLWWIMVVRMNLLG